MAKEGRPTKYSAKMVTLARKYLDSCEDTEDEFHKTRGMKSDSYERIIDVKLPMIEGLAKYLQVTRSTVYEWKDKHKEFSDILEEIMQVQAERLALGSLSNRYNPVISKLMLAKHGYRDSSDIQGEIKVEQITGMKIAKD